MQRDRTSLWDALTSVGRLSGQSIRAAASSAPLSELVRRSSLAGRINELRDRSVLIATKDQFATALALIELDGIARRVVLYPGDLPRAHVASVVDTAEIDALVSDWEPSETDFLSVGCVVRCSPALTIADCERRDGRRTEWVLLTSGTTGRPKLTVHTLSSLTGAITGDTNRASPPRVNSHRGSSAVWSTFYDIRRYGGLQIFLRALLDGASLVLSSSEETVGDFLIRAGAEGVTHISGTPSHWRRALMSPLAHKIAPQYVRLSGEIVDQGILDNLRAFFRNATIVHAFASTEAGVGFDVRDGLAGFPAKTVGTERDGVEIKIVDDSLRIRSDRIAARYLGSEPLVDQDGFVDSDDLVELRGDRYYFVGRRDGVINVGGAKVHPEEIEAVLNRHPRVQMSLVRARKNPITGAIVVADIVMKSAAGSDTAAEAAAFKRELIEMCNHSLAPYKVPAVIRFVSSLSVTTSGKLARVSA
jgi:acyl-coenzyme A synthetase/AMP-(fatty) acid ligase